MLAVVTPSRGGTVDWGKAEELKFAWRSVANKRVYAETHGYDLYVVIEPLQVMRVAGAAAVAAAARGEGAAGDDGVAGRVAVALWWQGQWGQAGDSSLSAPLPQGMAQACLPTSSLAAAGQLQHASPVPLACLHPQQVRPQGQWNKVAAARAVMAAAPHHEWLWLLDSDAFIMNLSKQLEQVRRMAGGSCGSSHIRHDLLALMGPPGS
jgi:hypothetical protein